MMNDDSLRQSAYISTASRLEASHVEQIILQSVENNSKADITGFLLFNGRNFMQLIEGGRGDLDNLKRKLARDSRHTGIVWLADEAISERSCEGWAMRKIILLDNARERQLRLNKELPDKVPENIRTIATNFSRLN